MYRQVVSPDWSTGDQARWLPVDYPESNDPDHLDNVGAQSLVKSRVMLDAFEFEITPGDTEGSGLYLPFKHVDVGDVVRVHTGTDPYDYDEVNVPVVGVRITLNEATDDSTATMEALSLHVVLEVGGSKSGGMLGTGGVSARATAGDAFWVDGGLDSGDLHIMRERDPGGTGGDKFYSTLGAARGVAGDTDASIDLQGDPALNIAAIDMLAYGLTPADVDDFGTAEIVLGGEGIIFMLAGATWEVNVTGAGAAAKHYFTGGWGVVFNQDLTADPADAEEGQVYWNTNDKVLRLYDGSTWSDVGSGVTPPPDVLVDSGSGIEAEFSGTFTTIKAAGSASALIIDPGTDEVDLAAALGMRIAVNDYNPDTTSATWHELTGGSGVKFPELAADPTSPFENLTYYNTTSNKLRTYDGTVWRDHW